MSASRYKSINDDDFDFDNCKIQIEQLKPYDRAKKVQTYTKEDARQIKMNEG